MRITTPIVSQIVAVTMSIDAHVLVPRRCLGRDSWVWRKLNTRAVCSNTVSRETAAWPSQFFGESGPHESGHMYVVMVASRIPSKSQHPSESRKTPGRKREYCQTVMVESFPLRHFNMACRPTSAKAMLSGRKTWAISQHFRYLLLGTFGRTTWLPSMDGTGSQLGLGLGLGLGLTSKLLAWHCGMLFILL